MWNSAAAAIKRFPLEKKSESRPANERGFNAPPSGLSFMRAFIKLNRHARRRAIFTRAASILF
jgi:hypothetical protein